MSDDARIVVEDLRKDFPRKGGAVEVLKGVSLTLGRGETLGIVGASGAGKTTLLQIVGTLDKPTSGRVLYDGRDSATIAAAELPAFRNRTIGFVFQFHHLLPEFNALENVMLPCLIGGMPADAARERAAGLLADVGLSHRAGHRVGEVSGGEQQRIAICRALATSPSVLLADEPTGNLDKATATSVLEVLLALNRKHGLSVIMVTHNEELASRLHRVVRIDDGRMEA